MSVKTANDIINMDGCIIRDENGGALARIEENDGVLVVHKFTSCSLGMYFYILGYLRDLGFKCE